MIGPLRMDIDSCIEIYQQLGKDIFPTEGLFSKTLGKHGKGLVGIARFDSTKLESCIKRIVGKNKNAHGPETRLDFEASRQTGTPKCKV